MINRDRWKYVGRNNVEGYMQCGILSENFLRRVAFQNTIFLPMKHQNPTCG